MNRFRAFNLSNGGFEMLAFASPVEPPDQPEKRSAFQIDAEPNLRTQKNRSAVLNQLAADVTFGSPRPWAQSYLDFLSGGK